MSIVLFVLLNFPTRHTFEERCQYKQEVVTCIEIFILERRHMRASCAEQHTLRQRLLCKIKKKKKAWLLLSVIPLLDQQMAVMHIIL